MHDEVTRLEVGDERVAALVDAADAEGHRTERVPVERCDLLLHRLLRRCCRVEERHEPLAGDANVELPADLRLSGAAHPIAQGGVVGQLPDRFGDPFSVRRVDEEAVDAVLHQLRNP